MIEKREAERGSGESEFSAARRNFVAARWNEETEGGFHRACARARARLAPSPLSEHHRLHWRTKVAQSPCRAVEFEGPRDLGILPGSGYHGRSRPLPDGDTRRTKQKEARTSRARRRSIRPLQLLSASAEDTVESAPLSRYLAAITCRESPRGDCELCCAKMNARDWSRITREAEQQFAIIVE